ncbi:hypothetical protein, partial [Burkholderia cepacia]|uniref:hypothetical protein n=1 Tax=Burkholderia cepacia TaxID=292 RepID=UPI0014197217
GFGNAASAECACRARRYWGKACVARVDGMENVKLEVARQMLFALLNIDFDYCHSGRAAGIFSGFPILALDDTAL